MDQSADVVSTEGSTLMTSFCIAVLAEEGKAAKLAGFVPTEVAFTDVLAARPVARLLIVISLTLEPVGGVNPKGVCLLRVVGSKEVLNERLEVVPEGGTCTTTVTSFVMPLAVARRVICLTPFEVPPATLMVTSCVAISVVEDGVSEDRVEVVTPDGKLPTVDNEAVPVNPLIAISTSVTIPLSPGAIVMAGGAASRKKL